MIVSLVSQKGGVGKSALARVMGVEFSRAGWETKIADLDPAQGTAARWKVRRDQAGLEPDVAVEKYRTVERAVRDADRHDLLILDGPAHAERGGLVMARASDLVIMPTGYSLDDLEPQVEAAYELEEAGIEPRNILFVFCRAKGSATEDAAARGYLRKARMTVLAPVFPEMPSIRLGHAEGRAATEIPFPGVVEKVTALMQEIAGRLGVQRKVA